MPASFCAWSLSAAAFHCVGVDLAGSTPSASSPMLPSSCGSDIIPTWPLYLGSNSAETEVMSSLIWSVLYAMQV